MAKEPKMTLEKLARMMANGFREIFGIMATKEDLKLLATKEDLAATERRLETKIDEVAETVKQLDEVDVRDLQHRIVVLEKGIRVIKRASPKT